MNFTFKSYIHEFGFIEQYLCIQDLSNEPHFYACSPDFIYNQDAPLHHRILNDIQNHSLYKYLESQNNLNIVVDSRVTQTMKGMYPSIPGWHCDSVPRSSNYNQPDLTKIDPNVKHFMCFLSSGLNHTETEFAIGEYSLEIDPNNVWDSVNKGLESANYSCTSKISYTMKCKSGEVYLFNQESLHRASPTVNAGWRLFLRLSFDSRPILNKIRKQVQIYTSIQGW